MPSRSTPEPTEAEIQKEAYLIWLASGCESDRALEHWLAAKELLRHRHGRPSGPRPAKAAAVVPVSLHFPPSADVRRPDGGEVKA
jgi:Protein of unknown function (DUF2934)